MTLARTINDTDTWQQQQIKIKQMQLKIAQEGDMPFVAAAIQRQLEELQAGNRVKKDVAPVGVQNDSQPETKMDDFQALMSLLDD